MCQSQNLMLNLNQFTDFIYHELIRISVFKNIKRGMYYLIFPPHGFIFPPGYFERGSMVYFKHGRQKILANELVILLKLLRFLKYFLKFFI